MKNKFLLSFSIVFYCLATAAFAQPQTIVINDPTEWNKPFSANAAEENLIKRSILPQVKKHWTTDVCEEDFSIVGTISGAFTKPNSKQTLILFQYCQTGNGFGNNGLVLIEKAKIVDSYVSEGGWALNIKRLPDINQNGLDEFAVYYSGGMHQGQGGTGVDVMEFTGALGLIKGLGWFQADASGEETGDFGWKVTVKPGKTPVFYREKYVSKTENNWRKSGKIATFKLGKTYGKFTAMK
jgi:hypothetical protein